MYYYIYDQFLSHKRYDKILAQIESKITDLGIKDRIIKMSILKSVRELVTDALRKGAKNIVAVGNNQTVNQIVNLIVGQDVTLGIIPLENVYAPTSPPKNSIAHFLGIHDPLLACEIVAARKIETINLGEVNGNYFINVLEVRDWQLKMECNGRYTVSALTPENTINIYNFAPPKELDLEDNLKAKKFFNPQDNFLELVIEPQKKKLWPKLFKKSVAENLTPTVFRVKKINIKNGTGVVLVDNFKILKPPLEIKVSDKKMRVIVGKERKF